MRCYVVEGGGFEPPKAEPADLQSAPFDRFGTPPEVPTMDTPLSGNKGEFIASLVS